MDGWMDGWVGGWMDGWMVGLVGGWVDGMFCPYLYHMAYNWATDFLVICFATHNVQVLSGKTMIHYA
jgi:organic anion transporter 5A